MCGARIHQINEERLVHVLEPGKKPVIRSKCLLNSQAFTIMLPLTNPNSPDLNPIDHYFWCIVERETNKYTHNTKETLKAAVGAILSVRQVLENISRESHKWPTVKKKKACQSFFVIVLAQLYKLKMKLR